MALGPGLPTRMVCPSPFWRTASAVPMVPPPPDRFSTIADWPHAVCRCAASNRPITSVVTPAAAGTLRRTFSVGRQSAAWPRRGKAVVADSAAAADSTRRRESSLVTFHSLLGFSFAGERRKCAGGRQADGLAQAPGLAMQLRRAQQLRRAHATSIVGKDFLPAIALEEPVVGHGHGRFTNGVTMD